MNNNQENEKQIITRLASLPPIEYERLRESEALNLGIRVSILDDVVKQQRHQSKNLTSDDLIFPEIVPWPTKVDGEILLTKLSKVIQKYVILTAHEANAIALWVVFTHCIDASSVAPILNICSPEKRCGKSTLITLLESFVSRPLLASNITPAAIFRTIEACKPTMLLDEVDTFIDNEKSELRGIINSGHSKLNAYVIRTVGEDHTPKKFSTWCAKCLAGIGNLPDTIKDRSISIKLRRKLKHENVDKLRHADKSEISTLQRQCVRFANDSFTLLSNSHPVIPKELNDRAADNWEILLAIADLANGDWPTLARQAAINISSCEESLSTSVELLQDIKTIFDEKNLDRLSTSDLLKALCYDDESPWATYNRGNPLSARQLAKRLKEFKISSGTIRLSNGSTPKGYYCRNFDDAFTRYIPLEKATPPQSIGHAGSEPSTQMPQNKMWRIEETMQPLHEGGCGAVADKKEQIAGINTQCSCGYLSPFCSCIKPDLNREITGES